MREVVECPSCGAEVEYDYLDDSQFDGSKYEACWSGNCPRCDARISWTEVYLFDRIENVKVEG